MSEFKTIMMRFGIFITFIVIIIGGIAVKNHIEETYQHWMEERHILIHEELKMKAVSDDPWERRARSLLKTSQLMLEMRDKEEYFGLVEWLEVDAREILSPTTQPASKNNITYVGLAALFVFGLVILLIKTKSGKKTDSNLYHHLKDENLPDDSTTEGVYKKTPTNLASRERKK